MTAAIRVEWKKARRRLDAPVAALIALLVLIWAGDVGVKTKDNLAEGYLTLFYGLPIMNTVIMPVGMAVLASRAWDMETGQCRLLFALQSRGSLFAAKALRLLALNALTVGLEIAGVPLLGAAKGFTARIDMAQLLWLAASTYAVNAMLLFGQLLLSIRSGTQALSLATGMVGSLLGVFTSFMPPAVLPFMPWSYYIPLSGMRMHYDRQTRLCFYSENGFHAAYLLLALALGALAAGLAWREIRRREG